MFRRTLLLPIKPGRAVTLFSAAPTAAAAPPTRQFVTSAAVANVRINKPYLFVEKERTFRGMKLPELKFFEPPAEFYKLEKNPVYDPLDVKMPSEEMVHALYNATEQVLSEKKDILPHGLPDADLRHHAYLHALGHEIKTLEEIRDEVMAKLTYREHASISWRRRLKNNPAWEFRLGVKRRHRERRKAQIIKQTYPW